MILVRNVEGLRSFIFIDYGVFLGRLARGLAVQGNCIALAGGDVFRHGGFSILFFQGQRDRLCRVSDILYGDEGGWRGDANSTRVVVVRSGGLVARRGGWVPGLRCVALRAYVLCVVCNCGMFCLFGVLCVGVHWWVSFLCVYHMGRLVVVGHFLLFFVLVSTCSAACTRFSSMSAGVIK